MRLLPDWRRVLTRAWSVRLWAVAIIFIFLDAALPILGGVLPIPERSFAILSGLAAVGGLVARLVLQDIGENK